MVNQSIRYMWEPRLWPKGSHPTPDLQVGKGDYWWNTKFTTKFSAKPKEGAPLIPIKGAAKVITDFLDRVAELQYMIDTQDDELATTRDQLRAHGINSISFTQPITEHGETLDITDSDINDTAFLNLNAMARRIEWEQYLFACGPVHTARFMAHTDGTLGIQYKGPSKDKAFQTSMHKRMKTLWLATHDRLPTVEEVKDAKNFNSYYRTPVLALATDETLKSPEEDEDPHRDQFHSDYIAPCTHVQCADVGYAGPRGTLGLDMNEEPEPGDIVDDEEDDA